MSIEFKSERLNIRSMDSNDWKSQRFVNELKDFLISKETSQYAVYDGWYPTDDSGIMRMAEWMPRDNDFLAVRLLSDDTFIGYIFHKIREPKKLSLGYAINSAYQNKGYGSEACRALFDYAFKNMGVECVEAGTANANTPSVRMLEKLNFRKMSERTQSHRKDEHGNPIEFIESLYLYTR